MPCIVVGPLDSGGGGVGIFYRSSRLKVVDITAKENQHEVIAVLCSLRGTSRKIICICGYLTTALTTDQSEAYLEYINDLIHSCKSRYQDPHILVAGDWNRADTDIALCDFPSICRVPTPPTRGDEVLDIINMNYAVTETEICPPLSEPRKAWSTE